MAQITFGILTVSDTCYAGVNEDRSGPELEKSVLSAFPQAKIPAKCIVPDCQSTIADVLIKWSSPPHDCNVILTTGGTGFAPRDVTPEATRGVIQKEAPGLSYAMASKSMVVTDMAMLSRAVCGIRNQTLIINLPGSVKGSTECFSFVKSAIPHAVDLLVGNKGVVTKDHHNIQRHHQFGPSTVTVDEVAKRNRQSPYPMLEVESALNLIFQHRPGGTLTEMVNIAHCLNRVLAEDVYAPEDLPPFPASIKDGYAVRSEDGPGVRVVKDAVAAGDSLSEGTLVRGEIVRISTGAAVPNGADAVVQVEDTDLVLASDDGKRELEVKIRVRPVIGQDIRNVGSDVAKRSLVLKKFTVITAGNVGVLAAVGKTTVEVYKKATVAVLSTGNELQDPHEVLKPGHVRDSNRLTLIVLLKQYGFCPADCGIAKDNPDGVKAALEGAFAHNDFVITTGGVSMGEFDLVKRVLVDDLGATIHFGRVNMKPGKPTTFATLTYKGTKKTVFALPGNPVSALVTAALFVIPALRYYENYKMPNLPKIAVKLGTDVRLDPRPEYARVALGCLAGCPDLQALPTGNQISSRIGSFESAGALLVLPARSESVSVCKMGERLPAIILEPLTIEEMSTAIV